MHKLNYIKKRCQPRTSNYNIMALFHLLLMSYHKIFVCKNNCDTEYSALFDKIYSRQPDETTSNLIKQYFFYNLLWLRKQAQCVLDKPSCGR